MKNVVNKKSRAIIIGNEGIEFYLEGEIGIGMIEKIPQENGNYKYEPYRGLGHYRMEEQVKAVKFARCCVGVEGGGVVEFIVTDVPKYGFIQVELGWRE